MPSLISAFWFLHGARIVPDTLGFGADAVREKVVDLPTCRRIIRRATFVGGAGGDREIS